MNKSRILLILCIFGLTKIACSQRKISINPQTACNASGRIMDSVYYLFEPSKQAIDIIGEITSKIGVASNFIIKACDVDNATAWIENSQRYILYNEEYIQLLKQQTTKWSVYFILAHEIGHHLDGHTITSDSHRSERELEADEFAGSVLYKLGATLEEAEGAVKTFPETASDNYPGNKTRSVAVARGWVHAREDDVKTTEASAPKKTSTDCELKQTGDYCFQNTLNKRVNVRIDHYDPNHYTGEHKHIFTLEPGQMQCLHNLKAISYTYHITEISSIKPTMNGQTLSMDGEINLEPCKSLTLDIK